MGVSLNDQINGNFIAETAFQERIEPVLIALQERDDDARQRAIAVIGHHVLLSDWSVNCPVLPDQFIS
jgi:hypothetical protein